MPQYFLSESDLAVLKRLLEQSKLRWQNTLNRVGDQGIDHQEHQAPETYVALTPPDGIPAMSGATPGSADCLIYQLIDGTIQQSSAHSQTLYNLAASALPGRAYITATRDKFGTWFTGVGGTTTTGVGGGGGICATVPLITDGCLTKDSDGNYHLTLQRQSFNTATCQLGVASCKTDEGSCCPSTGTSNDGPCCGLTDRDILCAVVSAPGCWLDGLTIALTYSYTNDDWEVNLVGILPLPTGLLVSSDPCNSTGRGYRLILEVRCVSDPTSPDFGQWLWAFYFETDVNLGSGYCVGAGGSALPSSCDPFELTLTGTLADDRGGGIPTCNLAASSDPLGCECVGAAITINVTKASGILGCQYPGPGTGTGGGSGGGPSISRASLGKFAPGNVASLVYPSSIVVSSNARLIVCFATTDPVTPTSVVWNGQSLTKDGERIELVTNDGRISIWSLKVTAGGSGILVVSLPTTANCGVSIIEVLNLPSNSVDSEADAAGQLSNPTIITGAVTADEYVQAAFLIRTASTLWAAFTSGGQDVTISSTGPETLTEGYDVTSSSASSLTAQLSGGPPNWQGVAVVYK